MVLVPFAIINLRAGLSEMDTEIIELGTSLTRSKLKNFCKLVIPMLYPLRLCDPENKFWG